MSSSPTSINTSAAIAGYYTDSASIPHGFFRSAAGEITPFDVPGSIATYGESINTSNVIAGYYKDAGDIAHGFIRTQ